MTSTVRSSVSFPRPALNGAADDLSTRRAAALSTLHDLVVGVNGHRDLSSTLNAVTAAACALGFGVAVVNLVRADGDLEVVAVAGDERARSELLGKVRARASWDELLAMGHEEHGVVFIDHREVVWPEQGVLATWVPESGDPDEDSDEDPDAFHPDDALFVHMVGSDGELVGTLSVDLPVDGRRPSPETRELLGTFGSHAALAIDHARLLRDLRSERADQDVLVRRLEALLELSRQLAATSDRARVVEVVTAALPQVVGCDEAGLLLWDPDRGALHGAGTVGLEGARREAVLSAVLHPRECPELVQILTLRGPLVLDADSASPVMRRLLAAVGVCGVLAVPIQAGDALLGVVTATWGGRPVPSSGRAETTARLGAVGDLASTALQNADLVEAVRHQSRHDELTGLPNRRLLGEQLDQLLRACADDDGVAVLFCDLDGFKSVNDSLGHAAGDELLRQAAARLRDTVRPSDVVGRLGGDEFALLLRGNGDELAAKDVAHRVTAAFARPFRIEGRQVSVTVSVGVAVHQGRGGRPGVLLGAADTAMYRAKRTGRNHVCSAGADVADGPAASLEGELAGAAEDGQLRLHFQPIVDVVSGRDVGAEALLRWDHPRLGLLPPGAFLPLAEEAGLMAALDTWVLRAACEAAARWPGEGSARVTVNVSGASLADPRLPELVRCALATSGLPARRLCLEVVESRSLVDLPGVVERLTAVRRLGVQVALDDFGTGFSTLTWLQHLPVDLVKVDRTFTAALGEDGSEALLRGVLALAGEVGVEVVTEGVETPRQLELVRAAGCRRVQGYLLGRPMPAPEWSRRLAGAADGSSAAGELVATALARVGTRRQRR